MIKKKKLIPYLAVAEMHLLKCIYKNKCVCVYLYILYMCI